MSVCKFGLYPGMGGVNGSLEFDSDGNPLTVLHPYMNSGKVQVAVSPSGDIRVCAGSTWSLSSPDNWITGLTSGRGSATIQLHANQNTGSARTGTVVLTATGPNPVDVYHSTVTVEQAGV